MYVDNSLLVDNKYYLLIPVNTSIYMLDHAIMIIYRRCDEKAENLG